MSATANIQNKKPVIKELIYSDPQLDNLSSTAQLNLFHSGVGSGKTEIIGARNAIYAKRFPHVRGFIGANTYDQLNKSTLVGVFKSWSRFNYKRDIHYVVDRQPPDGFKLFSEKLKSYKNTISFYNGKLIFLQSMDNYETIDGQEFGHADLDETKNTPEIAVREVILQRLRQKGMWLDKRGNIITDEQQAIREDLVGFNPLNIHTSPAKVDWIAEWFEFEKYYGEISEKIFSKTNYFRKRVGDKLIIISSTYHNEANLPKGFIDKKIIEPNLHDQHRIDMLLYGSPLGKSGSEYHNRFDRMVHIKTWAQLKSMGIEPPAKIPTHVGFDFNRVPYITSGMYKIWFKKNVQRWHIHKFSEICLPAPNNTTEHLCVEIIFQHHEELKYGVYIYGDYSGKNRRTNSTDNDYDVIKRKFKPYWTNTSDRVIVNQPIVHRKEFFNKIHYAKNIPIDYTCEPTCTNTIKDFEFLQEAPDGGKLKQKVRDENGNSYEKYGHCSDEGEYVVTSAFHDYFKM